MRAVRDLERDDERDIELYYEEFGNSSINFRLRIWIQPDQQNFLNTRHNAIKCIQRAFNENGLTIPFPIQTLDFSKVGGAQLQEFLPAMLSEGRGSGTPKKGRSDTVDAADKLPSSN